MISSCVSTEYAKTALPQINIMIRIANERRNRARQNPRALLCVDNFLIWFSDLIYGCPGLLQPDPTKHRVDQNLL
jgi:hypothetical protein